MSNGNAVGEVGTRVKAVASRLGSDDINLYGLSLEQLRQLHGDVWNGVRFFLTINTIVIGATAVFWAQEPDAERSKWALIALPALGMAFTLVGLFILDRHRAYYIDGLLHKTLLEYVYGLYVPILRDIDLTLPWRVPQRFVVEELLQDPEKWKANQKFRCGTISWALRLVYCGFLVLYVLGILAGALLLVLGEAEGNDVVWVSLSGIVL